MEPPVNRPTYPESATKGGLDPQKGVSILGRCFGPLPIGEISAPGSLSRDSWSRLLGLSSFAPAAYRLAPMRQAWVSEAAQIVSPQPENAVALALISSALGLLHPRHSPSIWSVYFVSVWGSRGLLRLDLPQRIPQSPVPKPLLTSVSAPAQGASPAPIDALNRQGPSGDDLASTPSASDIHPRSSRVGC